VPRRCQAGFAQKGPSFCAASGQNRPILYRSATGIRLSAYFPLDFAAFPCFPAARQMITKSHYEMMAELRYSLRKFMRFSEHAANEAGCSPRQYQALLAIKGFPGREQVTIGELAEKMQTRHHSMVGLANRLVKENYVRRVPGEKDRRQVFLALTEKGEALLEQLARVHREQWRAMAPHLESMLHQLRSEAPPVTPEP
jgi:DNA-binding MarR family transcriptional regulator